MAGANQSIKLPIDLMSKEVADDKFKYYRWMRENAPVCKAKLSLLPIYVVTRYDDCVALVKDPRFVRQRANALGKSWWSRFIPRSAEMLFESMLNQDDPRHKRLRRLVHKAFTPRSVEQISDRIEEFVGGLLDKLDTKREIDIIQAYALPIPVNVISWMLGIDAAEIPAFSKTLRILTEGMTGASFVRSMLWDMPKAIQFLRDVITRKRQNPGDDILTALIHAEDEGDRLTEDELVSMTLLLIVAGHETTVHLITLAIVTLVDHPDQLRRLQEKPELIDSAIEEVVRFVGPVHSTEMNFAREDITLRGVRIPKGAIVYAMYGAANRDPDVFDKPDVFDIGRSPNHHLGFGQGIHYCLGAPLARREAKVAIRRIFERFPKLRLAVKTGDLEVQRMPLVHRYKTVPVILAP